MLAACLTALTACGDAGAPNSVTVHGGGRINASAQAVSQSR